MLAWTAVRDLIGKSASTSVTFPLHLQVACVLPAAQECFERTKPKIDMLIL